MKTSSGTACDCKFNQSALSVSLTMKWARVIFECLIKIIAFEKQLLRDGPILVRLYQLHCCWRKASRGWDFWLSCKQDPDNQRLLPLLHPWNVPSTRCSHSGSHLQGRSLERAMDCWDHLDSVCDWTQWRSLYELLRFWQVGAEINSPCSHLR